MSKNIFTELKASYSFLSRVERCIADLILDKPEQFVHLTMGELSSLAGVSQGSINNFAKKFSPGGFSALKLQIASCLSSHTPVTMSTAQAQDVKACMQKKIETSSACFEATAQINENAVLSRVAQRILHARKIDIYGVYHSGIAARDLCYQLIQLGIPANFVEDTFMCAVSASMLDEQSLVIAISSSGRTIEIIDAVEIARENHVPIVCLTTNPFSPLAKISDDVLLSAALNTDSGTRVGEIRMAQLFVVDTLTSYLHSIMDSEDPDVQEKLRRFNLSHSIQD